jgi:hypothetical protein
VEGPTVLRYSVFLVALLLVAFTQANAGEDKDKKKPEKKPAPIVCTIELKDGTSVQGIYVSPKEIVVESADLGPLTLKVETVRFLDCERELHKLSTYNFEVVLGTLQTDEFTFKLASTNQEALFKRERIKRIQFPDPPRFTPTLQ